MLLARQYARTAVMAAAGFVGDSPLFLFDYLLRLLRVLALLAVWRIILEKSGPVSGMPLGAVLTYTLIAEVFAEQLTCRTNLEGAFWQGTLALRYVRPMAPFHQFAAEMLGEWVPGFWLFSLPLLVIAPLLGVDPLPRGLPAALCFAVSLALAISVGLAIEFAFAALSVCLALDIHAISQIRAATGALLSGAVIPLALLPWGLGAVFGWLPFAAVASAPLRLYVGDPHRMQILLSQAAWALILWPLARWLWRVAQERMISLGG